MAILYPKTKICVASATRSQGNELLLKITEDLLKNYDWGSDNLRKEIADYTIGANKAVINFINGSWIKVVTASDTARGARANILLVDEYWMLDVNTINTVLRRFLTAPRNPAYLDEPQYSHLQERNKEMYMGSAWMKSHWSFIKARAFFKNMLEDNKKYFLFSLPYQIAIKNNLLSREQIADEMGEDDFDEIKFITEMESLFFGDSDGSFYNYDDILNIRRTEMPIYDKKDLTINIKVDDVPELIYNERRILSVDIALMASTTHKNDASSIILNRALPTNGNRYIGNCVYLKNLEGIRGDDLALEIRRLYDYFQCTDLVIDANGLGIPICEDLMKDLVDPRTGILYPALNCCNNSKIAEKCTVADAPKVIWAIQANEGWNTEFNTTLRTGIQNGKINLLVSKEESDEVLRDSIKGYNRLSPYEKEALKMPFIQTDLLVRELVGLQHTLSGKNIKLKEKSNARKDRFSSLAYNYWVQVQIERELLKKPLSKYNSMSDYAQGLKKLNRRPKMY